MRHDDTPRTASNTATSNARQAASTQAIHARPTARRRSELGLTDEDIVRQLESGVGPAGRSVEPRR